jgi:enamine deaminase RidA (YjgF/YER057c/UK114 family)
LAAQVTLERINPEDLPTPTTYTHVVVASGTRLVFANLGRALAAAGARPDQVTKIAVVDG